MRMNHLSAIGVLLMAGTMVTGCGTFLSGSSTGVSSQKSLSAKVAGNAGSRGKASGPTTKDVSVQVSSGKSTAVPATPQYPSFGLDVTGLQVLALNERLAELGYLPVQISSVTSPQISLQNLNSPPQVTFSWRYSNVPSELKAQWSPTTYTQMTRAAVIAVERANGLAIDGIAGPSVWKTILSATAVPNPHPYTFVLVEKNPAPETLRVWQAGRWVYQSVANTGIPQMTTTDGTFAVYLRFASQTMSGTNPNGSHYSDPGVPYVNYFNGSQAIHGFVRASYGFPQSLGCVELPIPHAATVWTLLHYGTLVSVVGHYTPGSSVTPVSVTIASGTTSHSVPKTGQSPKSTGTAHSQPTGSGKSSTTTNPNHGTTTTTKNTVSTTNSTSNSTGSGSATADNTTTHGGSATGNNLVG